MTGGCKRSGGLSGHAGQSDLFNWLRTFAASNPQVCLTHGEDRVQKPFGKLIQERLGLKHA